MKALSLTTIHPHEGFEAEGRSVRFLDQSLAKAGVAGTTLVLKPWVPSELAKRVEGWRHLAVRPRVDACPGGSVIFSHYPHVPVRYSLNLPARMMAMQAERLIRRHGVEFDFLHGHGYFPAASAACLLARRFRVPFIITLRDDLSHIASLYERRGGGKLFRTLFQSVSAVFLIGPALVREFPSLLPPGANPRAVLAPNGVDVEGIEKILAPLPLPPARPWKELVSVANLFRFKGIHENLEALRMVDQRGFRDWQYTVVGEGPYRQDLQALAKDLGLADRVNFIGRVPHHEAVRRIHGGDIFCLPSWEEPFGNVYGEAAVCGRPAIGCRGFGAEMTIRDGETGILVPPKDVPALAEALLLLLTHPERAKRMGEEARKIIRRFTWDRTAGIYKKVIESLLSGGAAG
jgi:teichuronic acid biosynthesis glycosyltransferase TuaC